ncbi:hypothetical protein L1887_28386 [Cichorium endivia]|nr:hypothetical protein L1887_28386 [Cichorium endivia]
MTRTRILLDILYILCLFRSRLLQKIVVYCFGIGIGVATFWPACLGFVYITSQDIKQTHQETGIRVKTGIGVKTGTGKAVELQDHRFTGVSRYKKCDSNKGIYRFRNQRIRTLGFDKL